MTVFQNCLRAFNETPVDAKKSRALIAKLLRLIYSGETFPREQTTTLFFSISKLFQHRDSSLRQIVYLAIKELSSASDDILMVTSSIMKDVQNGESIYKPNAIRTLARVLDGSTVHATERLMKNGVVDKDAPVSIAALVSSYHLLPVAKDVVKRWTNETYDSIIALKVFTRTEESGYFKDDYISQYHALGLFYALKSHDKMALKKVIDQFASQIKNPLATVQLLRIINELLLSDNSLTPVLWPLIDSALNDRHHSISLEAIKVVVSFPGVTDAQFGAAVERLKILSTSPKVVTRFAAVRILNRISLKNHEKIVSVSTELESLITDPNRSIATYAITTLLKTGSSSNIERLIKVVSRFLNDISDEFKITIIDSIKTLTLKFPQNYQSLLNFLTELLNDEGGFEFKNAVVEALFDLIRFVPESRDSALENLCEFIEDCEFTEITVRVLNLLGNEGPKTTNPTLYIRHIYNRVVLENSIIRSAAVVALSKFALINDNIKQSIKILLKRIVNDVDDEVRDRAIVSLKFLESLDSSKISAEEVKELTKPSYTYDLGLLESKLQTYVSGDSSKFVTPFDISSVPKISEDELRAIEFKHKQQKLENSSKESSKDQRSLSSGGSNQQAHDSTTSDLLKQQFLQELSQISEFSSYGPILHSSEIIPLTERETEFVVDAIKHIFKDHLVLQFNVENTLDDVLLELITVVSQSESDEFVEDFIISIDKLTPHGKGTVYVSFTKPEGIQTTSFSNTLSFTSKECDPTTYEALDNDGFEDEYQIEELDVTPGDFISPSFIGNFDLTFDELTAESVGTFNLSSESIQETVDYLISLLSLHPIEGKSVSTESAHTLKLFGKSIDGERIALLVKLVKSSKAGVTLKAVVKSDDDELSEVVLNSIA